MKQVTKLPKPIPCSVAPPQELATKRKATKKLVAALSYGEPDCAHCKLKEGRRVAGFGLEGAGTLLVFSHPVNPAQAEPIPGFVRQVLLRLAKIDFKACWCTYACLCTHETNRPPTATMLRACNVRLMPEIYWHNPATVILFGAPAQQSVLPDYPVTRYHGKMVDGGDRIYVPMYDPFDADENPYVNEQLISDFKHLPEQAPVQPIEGLYSVSYEPTPLAPDKMISCDTETVGLYGKLLGGATTQAVEQAIYGPFDTIIKTLNQHPAPHLLCHNAKYDLRVLLDNGYKGHHSEVDDTEVLAYCMNYDNLKLKVLETQELNLTHPDYDTMAEKGTLLDKPIEETAQYCCQDTDVTLRLWHYLIASASAKEKELYDTCDKPLIPCLVAMERKGIQVDIPYVKEWKSKLQKELKTTEKQLYGNFDITPEIMVSPAQLGQWLVDRGIDLPITERSKQYKTGKRQLALYMHKDEVIPLILRVRQIDKLISTYVDAFLEKSVDGRLHTQYNQTRVATSRLSSSNPNLQNLPHVFEARRSFIARPGYVLIRIDYSAIDMMILAYLSQDPELMGVFMRGEDIHNYMSDRLFGDHIDLHRYNTKSASYAIIYGGGPRTMYEQQCAPMGTYDATKWGAPPPLEWFKKLIDDYFTSFAGIRGYQDSIQEFAKEHGYAEDFYGRRRYLPALSSPNPKLFHRALRQVLNFPIAGTAAGVFKLSIVGTSPIDVPVLNVHDELVWEVPEDKVDYYKPRLLEAMMAVKAPMQLKADAKVGYNLGEMM